MASSILADLRERLGTLDARRARPFVTLAYAQSLDGSIAGDGNRTLQLSCRESLELTHELRAAHDAILVGIGTVFSDDPRLNVRLVDGKDPRPIVVDSRLRIPREANLLAQGREVFIAATEAAPRTAVSELERRGATILELKALSNGWVDLESLLADLRERGIRHVLVEGGARILTSFFESRLADHAVVTISPRFVGGVRPLGSRELLPSARLGSFRVERLGDDLVVAGEILGSDA